jgi:hypothetical protein
MTKEEVLRALARCKEDGDIEGGHIDADKALIEFINDPDITKAYATIPKWYA